ncbi:MAG: hypothetical protein NZM04_09735 [Methylacidiphilales bacterium]|nr:hypothetical protein [Candidatus Methylacidiphilales bacterium]
MPVEGIDPTPIKDDSPWSYPRPPRVYRARIGTTRSGRPKLIAADGEPTQDEAIVVLRTGIGFRSGKAHTDESGGACSCAA